MLGPLVNAINLSRRYMGLHVTIKNLTKLFLITAFFYATNVHAEFLLYKAGDKASYTISQKLISEHEIFDEKTFSESEATINLDVEILSLNHETSNYPFNVKVVLRKIFISEIQQDGKSKTIISYDSDSENKKNKILATYFDKLINHPLVFRVDNDFQIKEITGYLTQIYENFDSPSPMGLFGATPWTFELLLTQLFHLSGENLLTTNSYPASCYQFLNWEDEALDEQEISLNQTSTYIVNAIDWKKIKASWKGNAIVASIEDHMNGEVSVIGHVAWDIANPINQKRDLEVKIEQTYNGFFPSHIKMSIQQAWQSISS